MADYLTHNIPVNRPAVLPFQSFGAQISKEDKKTAFRTSILSTQEEMKSEEKGETPQVQPGDRPALPVPEILELRAGGGLEALAKAFGDSFNAVSDGTRTITQDMNKSQLLAGSMSQAILSSTEKTIHDQAAEFDASTALAKYQDECTKINDTTNWWALRIGIAILVVATVVPFACAALPMVAGMLAGGAEVAAGAAEATATVAEVGGEAAGEAAAGAGEAAAGAGELTVDSESIVESSGELVQEEITGEENTQNILSAASDAADASSLPSARTVGIQLLRAFCGPILDACPSSIIQVRALCGAILGAGLSAPDIIRAAQTPKTVRLMEAQIKTEQDVADSTGVMETNNIFWKFYQQLIQREGTVAQGSIEGISKIIQSYGEITHSYENMASAV